MMKVNVGDKVSIYVQPDSMAPKTRIRSVKVVTRIGAREFVAGDHRYLIRSGARVGDGLLFAREYKPGDEELAARNGRAEKAKTLFARYERMFPDQQEEFLRSLDDADLDFLAGLYDRKMARHRKDEKGS